MKVAVVGAGIVGVTTAYELSADGHEVTVFERKSQVAEETSFANAGIVAPGYVTPWAAPGMPLKVLSHLISPHAPVRVRWPLSASDLRWMWQWWRACRLDTYLHNRARMQSLAFYSRDRLHHLAHQLQLDYERSQGYLVLLRTEKELALVQPGLKVLRETGTTVATLNPDATRRLEPALNPDTHFIGALHLPDDEVGNCRQFAWALKHETQKRGTKFCFDTVVHSLKAGPGKTLRVHSAQGEANFDHVIVCGGVDSTALLKPLGLQIPLRPVYGYSITAPVREALNAPRSALMDERYKVAISRMGQRVRVAGSAEIGGRLGQFNPSMLQTLYKVLHDWFPGAAQLSSGVQTWKGARPMMPDGPPMLGRGGVPGLWLNVGHGSSGWALSCGSARILADLVGGRAPEIDLTGLGIERLG